MTVTNNADNLAWKYGLDEAVIGRAGEYVTNGPLRYIEVTINDMTVLGTSAAIMDNGVIFPINVRIEKVDVMTITACTGTGAVLNVGLVRNSDRSTAIDADGFVAALPLTSLDAAGEITSLVVGSSYAGSSIGLTTATYPGLITADYDTAAFTAGKVAIRIWYSVPTT